MSTPFRPSAGAKPVRSFEIDPFVVWISFGTEIPKPSSQIEMASGTCRTPAAFRVSQNIPSLVPALPPVANVTSSPFFDRPSATARSRSEEHTSELQSQSNLVCRLLLEKKKKQKKKK